MDRSCLVQVAVRCRPRAELVVVVDISAGSGMANEEEEKIVRIPRGKSKGGEGVPRSRVSHLSPRHESRYSINTKG